MKRFLLFVTGIAMLGMVSACKEKGPHKDNIVKFSAVINSAPTIPKAVSSAIGTGRFEYNKTTRELSYTISYQNIVPTSVTVNYSNPAWQRGGILYTTPTVSTTQATGKFTLNAEQQTWLILGLFYVNIPTAANIYGEIRGQVLPDQID